MVFCFEICVYLRNLRIKLPLPRSSAKGFHFLLRRLRSPLYPRQTHVGGMQYAGARAARCDGIFSRLLSRQGRRIRAEAGGLPSAAGSIALQRTRHGDVPGSAEKQTRRYTHESRHWRRGRGPSAWSRWIGRILTIVLCVLAVWLNGRGGYGRRVARNGLINLFIHPFFPNSRKGAVAQPNLQVCCCACFAQISYRGVSSCLASGCFWLC